MLIGLCAISLVAGLPVRADEFNLLEVYGEAKPLNDQWQACAATFVRPCIQSMKTPETLAREALDQCRSTQDGLGDFLVAQVGKESAEAVMIVLYEKYLTGLAAAINELRTRD